MNKAQRELLRDLYNAALSAVDPYQAVRRVLRRENDTLRVGSVVYDLKGFDSVVVIGAGKAAAPMAAAVEAVLGDSVHSGIVCVKYGHTTRLRTVEQIEAAHPIPDEAGMYGTRKILEMLRDADVRTLVICLLSGGGSALLVDPLPGILLEDKQKTTDLLLRSGASVYELNTVLKHLSGVKGGRLARAAYPASVLTLTLSDVIGDRIDVIASGPMAPGNAGFCDAARVIDAFKLRYKLPARVITFIERGAMGQEPGPAGSREICFTRTRNVIVGGMAQALFSAGNKAKKSGYAVDLTISEDRGAVDRAAHLLAKKALRARDALGPGERRCLLFGRENPETKENVKSGRNQDLALAFAREISGITGIALLSAGTHGMEGSADAAGAVVDGSTAGIARARGIYPEAYLRKNDSYAFFTMLDLLSHGDHHVRSRPTGANAMDVQILLVEG